VGGVRGGGGERGDGDGGGEVDWVESWSAEDVGLGTVGMGRTGWTGWRILFLRDAVILFNL